MKSPQSSSSARDEVPTRHSLILRLPSAEDTQAWEQFCSIYEPLIHRFARRQGLQDADARELVQDVLISVAKSVKDWRADPSKGRFRAWLFRIARNRLIDHVRKRRPDRASGLTEEFAEIGNALSRDSIEATLENEHRRELFRAAAALVREEVQPSTWEAFWKTYVDGLTSEETAHDLGITVGAVYIARSRVLHRLRQHIETWESDDA
ncbi:MAG: sigma-70 family RNA polymerase sigma factor [Planctomycetota bacterium]